MFEMNPINLAKVSCWLRALVEDSYKFIAIFGQKPITKVGNNKLKPIVNSLLFISLTVANAGILGPKNTLLHIDSRYIGVRTKPIAAIRIVIDLKRELKPSWLVIPKNTVISLIKPLIPGSAREAKELAKKKANVIGKTLAKPPIFGIERVLVLS